MARRRREFGSSHSERTPAVDLLLQPLAERVRALHRPVRYVSAENNWRCEQCDSQVPGERIAAQRATALAPHLAA
jgi:hypothetical protein